MATQKVSLTQRELNRATLARQLLLDRGQLPVAEAVARLCGLQAQEPAPPYLALWTRLSGMRAAMTWTRRCVNGNWYGPPGSAARCTS